MAESEGLTGVMHSCRPTLLSRRSRSLTLPMGSAIPFTHSLYLIRGDSLGKHAGDPCLVVGHNQVLPPIEGKVQDNGNLLQ